MEYLKINDSLFFIKQTVKKQATKQKIVELNTHHTFIIDCSYSMYYELPAIRKDLYNKISTLLKPKDSVTIIWFSGKDQFGVLLEDYSIQSVMSLSKVKESIDKFLKPVGLTAFKQPLEELKAVIKRTSNNPDMLHSMFFLTDGHDNSYSEKEILKAVEEVKDDLNSATIVEYGWYCNRALLNKMSIVIGGIHTFSEDFQDYEPYIHKQFTNEEKAKKEYISLLAPEILGNIAFITQDNDVIAMKPNDVGEIAVSVKDSLDIFYLSPSAPANADLIGDESWIEDTFSNNGYYNDEMFKGLYASLFVFSRKNDYTSVSTLLKFLGDAYLINKKANTFGTQKITELEAEFTAAVSGDEFKYLKGYNPDLEPAEDAFCVIDLIEELMSDENNVWYPRHDAFRYSRTTRKKISKNKTVGDDDKKVLTELMDKNDIDGMNQKLQELQNKSDGELKFEFEEENPACSFIDLVWNETRANLSVRVNYQGTVNIPKNDYNVPETFSTNIFRNYTLIRDGIIHTYELPISLSEKTFNVLQINGLLQGEKYYEYAIYVLNFSSLPVVNQKMVRTLSAKKLFSNQYELMQLQSKNSVFNFYKKQTTKGLGKKFVDLYGENGAEWLKDLGLKEYGFNPPVVQEKTFEEIEINTLKIKVNKMSLIKVKKDIQKVIDKIANKESLTPREKLLVPALEEHKAFQKLNEGVKDETIFNNWICEKSNFFRREKARLMTEISKAKFLTIVGKSWFIEFKDRSETDMTLEIDGNEIGFTVQDAMETIKV